MTADDLLDKVLTRWGEMPGTSLWSDYSREAVAIVLEAAAGVAESHVCYGRDDYDAGNDAAARRIRDAIRALGRTA